MRLVHSIFRLTIAALIITGGASVSAKDDMRELLFAEVDEVMAQAKQARAEILSPESYEDALEYYASANSRLKKGQSVKRIKRAIAEAMKYGKNAIENARIAETTLAAVIKARADALKVNARQFSKDDWEDAEDYFSDATRKVESGSLKSAKRLGAKAEKYYRSAELDSIKANYLTEARQLIAKAEDDDVDDYAPITLNKAKSLLKEAAKELSENRYDVDRPRSLARNARYEASHAIYIAKQLKAVDDDDLTVEQLVLSLEKPITDIAGTMDIVATHDRPSEETIKPLLSSINSMQKDSYDLNVKKQTITSLSKEIERLQNQLGIQSQTLAQQAENRRRLERVEQRFNEREASVMTQGDNILIRLVGLSFRPARATIDPQYFTLLKKLENILHEFPNATAVVEGHTDSFGSDNDNFTLSQRRAEAVRSYLLANLSDRKASSIRSVGYGETRPIGNNETYAGRAKNRRIDLVVKMR